MADTINDCNDPQVDVNLKGEANQEQLSAEDGDAPAPPAKSAATDSSADAAVAKENEEDNIEKIEDMIDQTVLFEVLDDEAFFKLFFNYCAKTKPEFAPAVAYLRAAHLYFDSNEEDKSTMLKEIRDTFMKLNSDDGSELNMDTEIPEGRIKDLITRIDKAVGESTCFEDGEEALAMLTNLVYHNVDDNVFRIFIERQLKIAGSTTLDTSDDEYASDDDDETSSATDDDDDEIAHQEGDNKVDEIEAKTNELKLDDATGEVEKQ